VLYELYVKPLILVNSEIMFEFLEFCRNRLATMNTRQATHMICTRFLDFYQKSPGNTNWPAGDTSILTHY